MLDLEQSRVKECIDRVGAVAELKHAIGALHKAVEASDWEEATRCVQRARAVDQRVVLSHFAEAIVVRHRLASNSDPQLTISLQPTPDVPEPPSAALASFTATLTSTFLDSFTSAASERSEALATRFFKLFPLLGPEAETAGLSAYATFVCTLIVPPPSRAGGKAPSALLQLTALLEQVALIIAQHQPVVERHYGEGKMTRVVKQLDAELDRQSLKVLSTWEEDRRLPRCLAEARSYRFPHLSALHNPPPAIATTGGVGSAAAAAAAAQAAAALPASLRNLANVRSTAGTPVQGSPAPAQHASLDDDLPDLKAMDALIGEIAAISGRWQTYRRFLYSRLVGEEPDPNGVAMVNGSATDEQKENVAPVHVQPKPVMERSAQDQEAIDMIESSEVKAKIVEHLRDVYRPLESWYFRVSVEKVRIPPPQTRTSS